MGNNNTKLTKYDANTLDQTSIPIFQYGGSRTSAWSIPCYATVDGLALSSDSALSLGTSIDQSKYDSVSSKTAYNIYLTVTPMNNFTEGATIKKRLTGYNNNGKIFSGAKITKVNDNRFMVSWEEANTLQTGTTDDSLTTHILHYIFVDGKGNKLTREFTAAAPISDCQPIVKGSNVVYYASNNTMVNFYSISSQTGKYSKKSYRVAGENATWDYSKKVLTISGSGDMSMENGFDWDHLGDKVNKIVIKKGITSISKNAFSNLSKLKEVEIQSGVKKIEAGAFSYCSSLSKVTIPSSVTSMGKDCLWSGYYFWDGSGKKMVTATIYTPKNSYAMKYAKKNKIAYVVSNESSSSTKKTSIAKAKITGLKASYVYNGKGQKPGIKVKLGSKTLKKGSNYTISYSNNVNAGRGKIKIKGVGKYTGTVTKTFKIVPNKMTITKVKSSKGKTIQVTWKKNVQATGYQIQYTTDSKFKKGNKSITIKKNKTVSQSISKLTRKKTYYVRIRGYKVVSGKKYYGPWSKAASVKCK